MSCLLARRQRAGCELFAKFNSWNRRKSSVHRVTPDVDEMTSHGQLNVTKSEAQSTLCVTNR